MSHALLDEVRQQIAASAAVMQAVAADETLLVTTAKVVERCVEALTRGRKIMFAGNGGSAADAQHWAGELVSRFYYDRPGLPAIALSTDSSILTAIGNDYGYDYVFARQIEALGQEGDVFFAISTSGRSKNILRAIEACRSRGILTVGFANASGGDMLTLCDFCLRVPSTITPRVQEGHEALGHLICALIESKIFPRSETKGD